jgi:hypothetical protein
MRPPYGLVAHTPKELFARRPTGLVAQSVERMAVNHEVVGSNPTRTAFF